MLTYIGSGSVLFSGGILIFGLPFASANGAASMKTAAQILKPLKEKIRRGGAIQNDDKNFLCVGTVSDSRINSLLRFHMAFKRFLRFEKVSNSRISFCFQVVFERFRIMLDLG